MGHMSRIFLANPLSGFRGVRTTTVKKLPWSVCHSRQPRCFHIPQDGSVACKLFVREGTLFHLLAADSCLSYQVLEIEVRKPAFFN